MLSLYRRHTNFRKGIQHCCRFTSNSSYSSIRLEEKSENHTSSHTSTDAAQQETDYFIDARRKTSRVNSQPVNLTGKAIEGRIRYNSVIDSFVDRSSFLKRVEKYNKISFHEKMKENQEMLDKNVDSIVAKLMDSSSILDAVAETTENNVVEEPEKSQVTFPYLAYTPLSRKLEIFEKKQQSVIEKLQVTSNLDYGTPNPSVPVSQVACGGCGAHLHCQSPSLPGYLPQEIFTACDKHHLRSQLCQRCRFLREHNVALNVQISPEDYPKTISIIRDQMAMVILIVDLLDFPGSIWPDLLDIIGHKRPVCVVGNKVDLLPQDSQGYLNHIAKCLVQELEKSGMNRANIKHVCLVSAQTGYGVESLITKIQHSWGVRGDVYLLGCTNVGKSSLFNALIGSDFCKTKATDLLERATVSSWPGTTLNLLKFPLMRPSSLRLYERLVRLKAERQVRHEEEKLRRDQLKKTHDRKYATLMGHIGRTFEMVSEEDLEKDDPFAINAIKTPGGTSVAFNPNHKAFVESKWCYDTPGTVSPQQILTLLTLEELMLTLPNKLIKPRTLLIKPGSSYFLAGLGRIDYVEGPHSLMLTTFSSMQLPLSLVDYVDADEMYNELLGSPLLKVPFGNEERLKLWPGLVGRDITVQGVGWNKSCADIVLSSAGWVAVTGEEGLEYNLKVYTPEGRGIYVRDPPLLPHAVLLRGRRLERSQAFCNNRLFVQ